MYRKLISEIDTMEYPFKPKTFGLKYIVLILLMKKKLTGAEIIETINRMTMGFFSPSPGSVYPLLKMMLKSGYITVEKIDGKKVYSISKEGKEFIESILPPFNMFNRFDERGKNYVEDSINEIENHIQFLTETKLNTSDKARIKKLIKELQGIINQ